MAIGTVEVSSAAPFDGFVAENAETREQSTRTEEVADWGMILVI